MNAVLAGTEETLVLGVERSATGRRWLSREGDARDALALAQRLEAPEIVGRILAARGVDVDGARRFLNPTLRDHMPDPSRLRDLDAAAERVASAVMQNELIAVFGDYDVDGATSAALVARYIRAVGGRARIYIPDRLSEGYGPSADALTMLRREGASVAVTVDCGATAHDALSAARDAGLDVIVIDHHETEPRLPPAVAVVNPNRLDEDSGQGELAAVGVAFLFLVGLNRTLRETGWHQRRGGEPDLMGWLDLVALGTICDVVPLRGLNRALATQGLKVMARRANPGLRALADVAGVDEAPGAYHAGFVLGPRINAGGRVGEGGLGARLLATDDEAEARDLAQRLNAMNKERREIEAAVLEEATNQAEGDEGALVFVAGDWHPGVVGIVASRLTERFSRPSFVVALDGEKGSGSGRSVPGVDLGGAVIAARQSGLLLKGGGHAMAAGFTVEPEKMGELRRFLEERVARRVAEADIRPTLSLDGSLDLGGARLELVEALKEIGPFGAGNPEPRFAIPRARVARADVVGENHVRCFLEGADGGRLNAISFRSADTELGRALLVNQGGALHVAGRLRENTWQGRTTVQLMIDDAAGAD